MDAYLDGFNSLLQDLVSSAALTRDRRFVVDLAPILVTHTLAEALAHAPSGLPFFRSILKKQPPPPLEFTLSYNQQGLENLGYRLSAPANDNWNWLTAQAGVIQHLLERMGASALLPLHNALMNGLCPPSGARLQGSARIGVIHRQAVRPSLHIDYPLPVQAELRDEKLLQTSEALQDYLGSLNIFCLQQQLPGVEPVTLRIEFGASTPRLVCISQSRQACSFHDLQSWMQILGVRESFALLHGFYNLLTTKNNDKIMPPFKLAIGQNAGNVRPSLGIFFSPAHFVSSDDMAFIQVNRLLQQMGCDAEQYARASQLVAGGGFATRRLDLHSQVGIHLNGYTAAVQVGLRPSWERLRSKARRSPFTAAGASI